MLETTILKAAHIFAAPAKKCLPYVQNCDVFGSEHTMVGAGDDEAVWEQVLRGSRKKFEGFNMFVHKNLHAFERAFGELLMKYAYTERRPKWFIERYTEEESQDLARMFKESNELDHLAVRRFREGKEEDAFAFWEKYHVSLNEYLIRRDTHMARQLECAEESIRKRYPALQEKEPLKYTLFVGSAHMPEQHMSIPAQVVNIDGEEHILNYIRKNIGQGFNPELRRMTLANAVYNLRLGGTMKVPESELRTKGLDELSALFHTHYAAGTGESPQKPKELPKKSFLTNRPRIPPTA